MDRGRYRIKGREDRKISRQRMDTKRNRVRKREVKRFRESKKRELQRERERKDKEICGYIREENA